MADQTILEKLGEIGVKGLEEVGVWLEGAKDFVSDQAPLVCQEIINRGTIRAGVTAFTFLLVLVVSAFIARLCYKKIKDGSSDFDELCFVGLIFSSICVLGCFAGFMVNAYQILYIQLCPRLYIMEQIAEIVKQYTG